MLKRNLVIGTSVLALGVASPAFAFQGPDAEGQFREYEDSGAVVDATGRVIETLSIDIQTIRQNLIDGSFTSTGNNAGRGAVNLQQNNGSNNAMNAASGVVAGVGSESQGHTNSVATGASVGTESDPNKVENNNAFVFGRYPTPVTDEEGNFIDPNVDQTASDFTPGDQFLSPDEEPFTTRDPDRVNTITDGDTTDVTGAAFQNFQGVVNVQQNNGDANSMGQAQAVFANRGFQDGAQDQSGGVYQEVIDGGRQANQFEDFFSSDADAQIPELNQDPSEPSEYLEELDKFFESATLWSEFDQDDMSTDIFPDWALNDLNTRFENTIDSGSFNGAGGSFQIQQNNGNNNAIGASTQVLAHNLSALAIAPTEDDATLKISGGDIDTTISSGGLVQGTSVFDGDIDARGEINEVPTLIISEDDLANVGDFNGDGISSTYADAFASAFSATSSSGFSSVEVDPVAQQIRDTFGLVSDYTVPDLTTEKRNDIDGSFNAAADGSNPTSGLVTVQQNNGHGNTIGAATQVATQFGVFDDSQLRASASVDGVVIYNLVFDFGVDRRNSIVDSFTDFQGAANVQQNNGHANSMNTVTAINAGIQGGDAVGNPFFDPPLFGDKGGTNSADLDASVARNTVLSLADDAYNNTVSGSFNGLGAGFQGVANVQQNNGSSNVMNSAVGVSVTGVGATFAGGQFSGPSTVGTAPGGI